MQRRHFLKAGSVAGITLTSLLQASCNGIGQATQSTADNATHSDDFELNEVTIAQLQEHMKSGKYNAVALTNLYLKRIATLDKAGSKLNAVIELNPEAVSIADALDKERANGKTRGPLHGIPVLIKDNINTGDKMMTTAGALALVNNYAAEDAFIIKKLREAGAIILGKTNLSEWANFRSTRSTSAWSSRGGQTKMPYILDRNPSGSSSGTGSGVAANFCTIGIGTETDGSVVSPAAVNGLVGIKPTVGLLSRTGIIPISKTQDTAGPIGRTVTDVAILLGALTGTDHRDEASVAANGKALKDYTSFLNPDSLKGKRIGMEQSFLKGNPDIVELLQKNIEILKSKGAEVIEIDLLGKLKDFGKAEYNVLLYEFKDGVNKYLATAKAPVKSIQDVINFNKQNQAKTMPYFRQEILDECMTKGDLNSKEYLDALKISRDQSRSVIDGLFAQYKLDCISGTTNGLACCIDLANGDYDTGFSFSTPAAMAGYPHITVPMGMLHNLPMGISFFGLPFTEGGLLGMAYAFEQVTKKRTSPRFIENFLA